MQFQACYGPFKYRGNFYRILESSSTTWYVGYGLDHIGPFTDLTTAKHAAELHIDKQCEYGEILAALGESGRVFHRRGTR